MKAEENLQHWVLLAEKMKMNTVGIPQLFITINKIINLKKAKKIPLKRAWNKCLLVLCFQTFTGHQNHPQTLTMKSPTPQIYSIRISVRPGYPQA
jgi:hypothetical protein